ncbi:MAG: hypothetical protein QOE70_3492 [Chthoniobacter sp.]|jgi:hypothetical protein|nr:hypothetical protein [Chthoniobacter sp.]
MPLLFAKSLSRWLLALAALLPASAGAQELRVHPTPFSVWLDFQVLATPDPPKVAMPVWLESLQSDSVEGAAGEVVKTTFRLRFRPVGGLNRELLLRLIFDDVKGALPMVTGWSETGGRIFEHGPLGNGLNLPNSAALALRMEGVNYIDISVPGDGTNVRGAFLTSLRRAETRYGVDFAAPAAVTDAFGNLPASLPAANDSWLLGRVKATIDAGVVKLAPREAVSEIWEFELAEPPLVAVLTFEILNADPLAPPDVFVNDQPLGPAALHTPDLADPAYQGVLRPLDRGVRFRYAGWLPVQKAIPGSLLRAGLNKILLKLPADSGPVAVRSLELQLKSQWQNLDSQLSAP